MNTLFSQKPSRALVLGAGSLGCLAARYGAENGDESSAEWSAAHVHSAELIATGLEKKLFLKMGDGPFAARGLARSLDENLATLEKFAHGRDAAILCGELSDPLAMQLIEALSSALSELSVNVFALVIEPFSPNGEVDLNALEIQRERFAARIPFAALLNPGMENVSAGVSAKRIRKMAAERLASAAECLSAALGSASESTPRLKSLRGMHRAVFATAANSVSGTSARQTSAAVVACDLALAALDDGARECIEALAISSPSEISFRETNAIAQKMPLGAALIATANHAISGHAECLLLSGAEKSANVVGIGSAFENSRGFAAMAD